MHLRKQFRRHWRKLVTLGIALLVVAGLLLIAREAGLDVEAFVEPIRRLPLGWYLVAFFFLPLLGFPVSVFLVIAGIRFGLAGGMLVAAGIMLTQNLVAYYLVQGWLRDPVKRLIKRFDYKIPAIKKKHQVWFTAAFVGFQGPPYIAKIYLLALTNLPFKVYFGVGAPVHVFFAVIPVAAGSAFVHLDPRWLYAVALALVLLVLAGHWVQRVVRRRMAAKEAVNGEM